MAKPLISFKIEGAAELERALSELPKASAKSTLTSAAKKALAPVKAEAEALSSGVVLKEETGRYAESWKISTRLKRSQLSLKQDATVYCGSTDPKSHLLEFGHMAPDGSRVRPYPVLRPAWDAFKDQVRETFAQELWAALLRTAQRLRKKATKLGEQLNIEIDEDI
jgi:hypothetical protein